MRAYDLILKKRMGGELTEQEIQFLISGYVSGAVADYQMAAWAMAVWFRGMSAREVAWLTQAMVASGDTVDLSAIDGIKVDKHSTGGVGDTTTLVLAPLVAAAGVPFAKMSGRGLGHTGGTLDKLESFPGFQVELEPKQFIDNVNRYKLAVVGQSARLAPADGKLYGLRDVTATVDSLPLIASSVMSKKLAAGADALVLDVKVGNGAFMQSLDDAFALAGMMVEIGEKLGRRTIALITAMDRPLGQAVGNALEVKEAIAVLSGAGPEDLKELCLELGSRMLVAAGAGTEAAEARFWLQELLASGAALAKFRELISVQGGDAGLIDNPQNLPRAPLKREVRARQKGWVSELDTRGIGAAALGLGAGRVRKDEPIDLAVGIEVLAKPGQQVELGQVLAVLHGRDERTLAEAQTQVQDCYTIGPERITPLPLICGEVSIDGEKRF
ncbi:MAG: pyrimidine-nucleoside phosphorylase [Firmicutes bacterium]|nr:pyrimidine-nucleoside phosphorylase [Bacillota bacterium]